MRRSWGFLACFVLSLIAFAPALTNAGLPDSADMAIHYWRAVDLENNWRHGDALAYWSELYYYGYGAPSFQYTVPGLYAAGVMAGEILPFDDVGRLKAVWFAAVLAGCWGMFRLTRRRGEMTALVCAAAYTFAPALLFYEPIGRGSLGVALGMGFLALGLSFLDDVLTEGKYALAAALSLAVMLLSHNLTSITGAGIAVTWIIARSLDLQTSRRRIFAAYGAVALACCLCAFVWLPILLERGLIDVSRMQTNTLLDFHYGFFPLTDLLGLPQPFDGSVANNPTRPLLGLAQWIPGLAAAALTIISLTRTRRLRGHIEALYWLLVAAAAVFLVTSASAPLWERVGALQQFLFPVRFLNVAALALAVIVGAGLSRWRHLRYFPAASALLTGVIVALGLVGAGWRWRADFPPDGTSAGYLAFEIESGVLGGTAANEFLPLTVFNVPPPTGFLIDSLSAGENAQRINTASYPAGFDYRVLASSPREYTVEVDSSAALTLEIYQLAFPAWQATVNGASAPLRASVPFGFTLVDIPAGTSIVTLKYVYSGVQTAGIGLSIGAVCAYVALAFYGFRRRRRFVNDTVPRSDLTALFLVGAGLCVAVGGLVGFQAQHTRSDIASGSVGAQYPANITFDGGLTLLGYDIRESIPGQYWRVDLHWAAQDADLPELNAFIHIIDENGVIVAQHDKLAFNRPMWDAGMIFRDGYYARSEGNGAADYRVRVGVWRCLDEVNSFACANPQPLAVYENGRRVSEDVYMLPNY